MHKGFLLLSGCFCFLHAAGMVRADDWPQWLGPERDAVWRETGIIQKFPAEGPPIRWRTPLGGGYAGPAVVQGKVYVIDRQLSPGTSNPADPFQRGTIAGSERVLCFDARDGKLLWKHEYDCPYTISYPAGPRTTPAVSGNKVYTLGAEGHLLCLNRDDGKLIWSHDFKKKYEVKTPLWGFAGNPLIDGQRLICLAGGDGSTVVALDKDTGKELWRALSSKEPGYSSPVIYEAGGRRQLILWHPEAVNSLDPETGKVYWSEPFPARSGMTIATPRKQDDLLFLTCFYNGSLMLRLDPSKPAATPMWRTGKMSEKETTHLNAVMTTPFLEPGYIYGVCSYGQLRCLRAETGERVWETFQATTSGQPVRWANAFIVKNADRYFLFNEGGDLAIARLTPQGYQELSRAHLLKPTGTAAGRNVLWSHPAFADRSIYVRNDQELLCADLAERPRS